MNSYNTESLARSFLVHIHQETFYINVNRNNGSKLKSGPRGPNSSLFASRILPLSHLFLSNNDISVPAKLHFGICPGQKGHFSTQTLRDNFDSFPVS